MTRRFGISYIKLFFYDIMKHFLIKKSLSSDIRKNLKISKWHPIKINSSYQKRFMGFFYIRYDLIIVRFWWKSFCFNIINYIWISLKDLWYRGLIFLYQEFEFLDINISLWYTIFRWMTSQRCYPDCQFARTA